MAEGQSYVPFRNGRTLLGNSCYCGSQDGAFDLERYGVYIDKMRALFAPSLEHRIFSFLKEFVYSRDSRSARRFPCFKKLIDTIVTWKEPLRKIAEYDIGIMEEMIKNTVKFMIKGDLVTAFLETIILNNRLKKICCELDAIGIKDDILKYLNVWNFINEKDYWMDHNRFMNSNATADCSVSLSVEMSSDTKESFECKKPAKSLATNNICCEQHMQPTTSRTSWEYQRFLNANQNFSQRKEITSDHPIYGATLAQRDDINKTRKLVEERSCNTESEKIRSNLRLKIIIRKMYLGNRDCSTFLRPVVTHLSLPCKPKNLIERIFEADPSLFESCLIVMKRKFLVSMYNVCSCLNDVLGKLDVRFMKALYLDCEIRPGYISFKLKTNDANNTNKCLFVARVPICQSVCKLKMQENRATSSCKLKSYTEVERLKCSEECNNNHSNFDNTFAHINEEGEKLDDTYSSKSNQRFVEHIMTNMSLEKKTSKNEEKISSYPIKKNDSIIDHDFGIYSCNKSLDKIDKKISNTVSCTCNSEKSNIGYHKISDPIEISCNNNVGTYTEHNFELNDPIARSDEYTRQINNLECACLPFENLAEESYEVRNIFSNKNAPSCSQNTDVDETWNSENENYNTNTPSIFSFVGNLEDDKQVVELNCNHFLDNNIIAAHKRSDPDTNSLNLAKIAIGCDVDCHCCHEDIITVTDNTSEENISRALRISQDNYVVKTQNENSFNTTKISFRNNTSLTVSIQTSNLKTSSKGINVNMHHTPSIIWLTTVDDNSIPTIRNRCKEIVDFPARALIIAEKIYRSPHNEDNEISDMNIRTCSALNGIPIARGYDKERFLLNTGFKRPSISTEECVQENHSICLTSNASQACHSFITSEFTMSDRQDKLQKLHKSTKKLIRHEGKCVDSNDIRKITSITTIKYKAPPHKYRKDYSADILPLTTFRTTKFHKSVNKSMKYIKRLIRTTLGKVLFNNEKKKKGSSKDNIRVETSESYIKQDYSITSYSTCDYYQRSCTISRKSSIMIPSICRNREKKMSEKKTKLCDRRLTDDSEVLSTKARPWFYYSLIATSENPEDRTFFTDNQYSLRKGKIKNKQNGKSCNTNSCQCDLRNQGKTITISSQSAEVFPTEDDSKYSKHHTCKQQRQTCGNNRVCKKIYYRDRRSNEKMRHGCRLCGNVKNIPIKYINSNQASGISTLSHTWKCQNGNMHKQFRDVLRPKNVKELSTSAKRRDSFARSTNASDFSNDLYKGCAFPISSDTYNSYNRNCAGFKSKLLEYVELCKNVKHSLMRTLQPDDSYEVSTASMPCDDA